MPAKAFGLAAFDLGGTLSTISDDGPAKSDARNRPPELIQPFMVLFKDLATVFAGSSGSPITAAAVFLIAPLVEFKAMIKAQACIKKLFPET